MTRPRLDQKVERPVGLIEGGSNDEGTVREALRCGLFIIS